MANNTFTYRGYKIVYEDSGYLVLSPIDNTVLGVAMDMEEVHDIILHH